MDKKLLTVVGPTSFYPKRELIEIGDTVFFKKHQNPEYPEAILCLNDSGEELGQVAASISTALGSLLVGEVQKFTQDNFEGKVVNIEKNSRGSTVLIVEFEELLEDKPKKAKGEEKMEKTTGKTKGREATVVGFVEGTKMECKKRFDKDLIESLRASKPYPCKIVETDDKLYISIKSSDGDEGYCGFISENPTGDILPASEIVSIMDTRRKPDGSVEYDAFLTGLDEKGLRMILEVAFTGKTAVEEVFAKIKKDGILDEKGISERLKYVPKDVSERNVVAIFKNMKKYKDASQIPTESFKFMNYDRILQRTIAAFNA